MAHSRWVRLLEGAIVPIVLLIVWQAICDHGWVDPRKLPSPYAVAVRWAAYVAPLAPYDRAKDFLPVWLFSGEFFIDALSSLYRVTVGFLVGAGLALPLGLIMGTSLLAYRAFNPLLQMLRPIPPIAYIPLAILWFGLGNAPAIFLISLGAFFPVLINTITGVRAVDSVYLRAARNLGASQTTIFRRVILPAATPYIFSGIRVGIGIAFFVVIVAELIAVNEGLGFRIMESREFFWADKVIAGMFSIGLIGLIIDTVVSRVSLHLLRWHRGLES